MIRKIVSKINQSLTERAAASRKHLHVPIKIWFEPDRNTGKLQMPIENLVTTGETEDLSRTGLAFIVSSIRIRENYLVGDGRTLNVELDLPSGKVQMQVIGRRHKQVGQHLSTSKFLVGAEIVKITDDNREAYEYFLRYGGKRGKGNLALNIDES